MKKYLALRAFALLLTLSGSLHAGGQPSKTQQLASSDQVPEGLAKSDWQSIRAAYEAGRHSFVPIKGGWQARNPGQQWTTRFDGRGFVAQPREGDWTWGLELTRYGFHGAERTISGTPAVKAEGQRLSYQWDATVQEWWLNDTRGLEHGFTVAERPGRSMDSQPVQSVAGKQAESLSYELAFTLSVRGTLSPKIMDDAQGVIFHDSSGATVLNYSGLKVWDANGKVLTSRFEAAGEKAIRLLVDERGARYPLTIDPIAQQAYLKSSNNGGTPIDIFGSSVAVAGETVVVGAPFEDSSTTGVNSTPDEGAIDSGAAYVFVRSGTTWSQQAYLKASNTGAGDEFGDSVSVSGDTVVVGAFREDSSTSVVNGTPDEGFSNSGAAYVFVRSGTTWSQQAFLKANNPGPGDLFGQSVSVSGDTVVAGAVGEDSSTGGVNGSPNDSRSSAGAAYVFIRSGTTWSQQAFLKASQVNISDTFGTSVSVSGNTVVVGAPGEDSSTTGVQALPIDSTVNESASASGAAYVFVRSGTTWTQQAYLKASQVTSNDNFGTSVAVSGDTVVVGASGEDSSTTGVNSTPDELAGSSGAVYVFLRSGTTWSQQAYIKASNTGSGDSFGSSVSVSGDTVVVGAEREDSSTTGVNSTPVAGPINFEAGAAYVFVRSGTTWSQQAYLKAGNTGANDRFGLSVSVSGDTVVVGAEREDSSTTGVNSTPNESGSDYDSGAAYVFVRSVTTWSQQAFFKASNTEGSPGLSDAFGVSVAISGDTVVVGASGEDSNSTGVNSTPNEGASSSGAAYVFVRSGTTWSQQAYLKAGNTGAGDEFGSSVSISGDTLVVGAYLEDSSTTGVNSTPDEGAIDSGAAYVFVRNGTTWSQQAYLKAGNTGADDLFGLSVSVSGGTVVVGAYQEDSSTTGVNSTPDEGASASGAAYVFVRSGTTWSQQAYLKAGNTGANDVFGLSVSVSGDTVVVGAQGEASSTTGVNSTPDESASSSGAVYVFLRSGTTWSQQAYLKASNTGAFDGFGGSVSVSGDTLVGGANFEDSSTTGVNSTPNESASNSGAVYVFLRSGTTWSQQAYLKASNPGAGDEFGSSVSVSGDTVVVGARGEDSWTTGVNSEPNDFSDGTGAGAAYIFLRSGTAWNQKAYLKASQVTTFDSFGRSVSVSGDTVVVGASGEDSSTTGVNSLTNESSPNSGAAYIFSLGTPDIAVTQAAPLIDGAGSLALGTVAIGAISAPLTFTITNPGTADLTSLVITKDGADAGDFTVSALSDTSIPEGAGTVSFTVIFSPTSGGIKTADLDITSNVIGTRNPFDIQLTGLALSFTQDGDGDGMNDAAELQLAPLGFDWQTGGPAQATLVSTYYAGANGAGLFTPAQVQALNVGTPLIQRNPNTGIFTLTIGVEKSTTLAPGSFLPFSMLTAPGAATSLNGAGKLEFQFTSPDNAAFFQLRAD